MAYKSTSLTLLNEILKRLTSEEYVEMLMRIEVKDIIKNKITDEHRIETALDLLLNYCYDDRILLLYRTLCKHYISINPEATLHYINYYIEEYDPEKKKFGHGNFKPLNPLED